MLLLSVSSADHSFIYSSVSKLQNDTITAVVFFDLYDISVLSVNFSLEKKKPKKLK